MFNEKAASTDTVSAGLVARTGADSGARAGGVFHVECLDKDGNLKWKTSEHNLVVNQGLQDMNTQYFKGSTYSAAFYLGLITGPGSGTTFAAADTLASKAWTEFTDYSGSRKLVTFGTATTADPSVISNSASPSSFSISGAVAVSFTEESSTRPAAPCAANGAPANVASANTRYAASRLNV